MDRLAKLQRDLHKAETEKKDGLVKIQSMNNEIKELKRNLEEFEANKSSEIRNLEQSLTKSLTANKTITDHLEQEKTLVRDLENLKSSLEDDIEKMKIDARKSETEISKQLELIKNKKMVEEEMLANIRDLEAKIEKFEEEKKVVAKAERMRKSSVATKVSYSINPNYIGLFYRM